MNTRVVFSIGSNHANSRHRVEVAIKWLERYFGPLTVSTVYSTPELSGRYADYSNAIAIGQTELEPEQVEKQAKAYEQSCGRTTSSKQQGRVAIDVDLVMYGNATLRPKELDRNYFRIGWTQLGDNHSQNQHIAQQKMNKILQVQ